MNRSEHIEYLKLHRMYSDGSMHSIQIRIDSKSQKITSKLPIQSEFPNITNGNNNEGDLHFPYSNRMDFNDSSIRVIKLGGVEDLNPLTYSTDLPTVLSDPGESKPIIQNTPQTIAPIKRECKVPNIPSMIRCQNCDTNFPTKYQFQRHQCEFNAEKVVLKPNIDVKDVEKGVRMKFDCPTCGKQFVSKNNLERHLTSHDEDNVNICEYCNKQFVSENRLRIHKENHCKKAGDISKFYRSDVTVWKCIKCYQVFSSDSFANIHADNCNEIMDLDEFRNHRNLEPDDEATKLKEEIITLLSEAPELAEAGIGNSLNINTSKYVDKVLTELLLQCEYCNKTYAEKKSLLMHQNTHSTEVNYNCVTCNDVFDSYILAAKHWLTKCSNEANLFYLPKLTYCRFCDRTFKSHEVLYSHKIKKKHYNAKKFVGVEIPDETNKEIQIDENKETIIKLIEDVLCSIKLTVDEDKLKDGKQVGNIDIEINDLSKDDVDVEKDDAELDKENDDPSDIIMRDEDLNVKSEVNSENSSLVISEDNPEGDVSMSLKKKRGRKRKEPLLSTKAKRLTANVDPGYKYQCERCVRVFDSVLELENHRDKDHPANYKCEECDQVVHSSKALLIHSRAHQSLKPYVCEICKRCYSQTSHLWQHMRFHQGIKPFACPHEGCEARYTIRPDLKDHIRKVHTRERPFKCSVCDKCFLTGSVYYQHRLIHTNDRRYACDICNKRFFRADALNNHRRIHTDERPYPCDVCGRQFRQKGDRNKHVRTQHPEFQL